MASDSPARTRLGAFLRAEGIESVVALGWATVDLDRAALELAAAVGLETRRFIAAPDSLLLGARCRIAADVLEGGSALVLLEPFTEGRMAASLARFGEGPVAVWRSHPCPVAPNSQHTFSSERAGPLGLERLELGGPVHGPHRLILGRPGTIR